MNISGECKIELVKKLREETGWNMMDCKRALRETDWKIDDAKIWLANFRKKNNGVLFD